MKRLNAYITESLLTGKVPKPSAKVVPRSKEELQQLISERIKEIKPRPGQEVDLNWIDISEVDDLGGLFEDTTYIPVIDTWKVDHVKDFHGMFANNKYIVHSPLPVLQKKLLMRECYICMFYKCTSLEEPPTLPATELTPSCYFRMFQGCESLKVAPELPAAELINCCYTYMFADCTSLKVAPELPATKLDFECYYGMFWDCSSLEEPPTLPAVQLAHDCYYSMFRGCKSLKRRATVPAEVLISAQYGQGMYVGCSRIKHKKTQATPHDKNQR